MTKHEDPRYVKYWIYIGSNGADVRDLKEQLTEHGIPWIDTYVSPFETWPVIVDYVPKFNFTMPWGAILFNGAEQPNANRTDPEVQPQWVIEL